MVTLRIDFEEGLRPTVQAHFDDAEQAADFLRHYARFVVTGKQIIVLQATGATTGAFTYCGDTNTVQLTLTEYDPLDF